MKKPDYFNKAASEKLNLDLNLVKKVNKFFWRHGVKENLSRANYRGIFIKNFGTITISKYKLYKEIITIIRKIRAVRNSQWYTEKKKGFILEQMYINLKQLLDRRNEIAIEYFDNEQANRISKTSAEGIKEPSQDNGRIDEQHLA